MNIITFDFETYYDKEYSLSTMSMWDYITDPRFQVIGVSVKVNDETPLSFSGDLVQTHQFLASFDWDDSLAVAHNAAFDLAILKWRFGISPKARADTWSMCNAIHGTKGSCSLAKMAELYGLGVKGADRESAINIRREDFRPEHLTEYMAYCRNDSELTYKLFITLMQTFPADELKVIDWTMKCYAEPQLKLDLPALETELKRVQLRIRTALNEAGITDKSVLRQDDVLAEHLRSYGVEPPVKTTPKGNKKYAFAKADVEFLELREHDDPHVQALVEARLESKSSIEETRLKSLIRVSRQCRGLPFPITYFGASTGRWAAWDDINLQNLPKKGNIRDCIIAPEGQYIAAADLSQIELRILAWASGQQDTLDQLANGEDVYATQATSIYGYEVNKHDHPTQRFVGKGTRLGCGFGCSHKKLKATILSDAKKYGIVLDDTSDEFFAQVVTKYRQSNPYIVSMWNEAKRAMPIMVRGGSGFIGKFEFRGNTIICPRGLPLVYNNLRYELGKDGEMGYVYDRYNFKKRTTTVVKVWHGLLVENIVQAVARDVFVNCNNTLVDHGYNTLGAVHDELLMLVPALPEDEMNAVCEHVRSLMSTPPAWLTNCPLDAEVNYGRSYKDAK